MNANELRLGNSIMHEGKIITVDFDLFSAIQEFPHVLNRLSGIDITPEILEKCGFEDMHEKTYGYVEFADKLHAIYSTADGYSFHPFCTNDKDCQIKIKFLHQLQNLIFALTGEELTYKQ
jgi:hypothetical protein